MVYTECQEIQGAMYGFPSVQFSEKARAEAERLHMPADFMYCMDLVNETGIMTVPGSGFGQKEGTFHYRVTNLVTPTEEMAKTLQTLKEFNERFHARF
mmetsp:Transcript_14532/g.24804  ORF Transcript_14532/g.24804 Transcript_14532/m.24804 type:complete len:98 (+) Transcript_14532:1238-1531(+)